MSIAVLGVLARSGIVCPKYPNVSLDSALLNIESLGRPRWAQSSVRTLVDEPFEDLGKIEEPVDGQRALLELVIEIVVVDDRAVLVGRPGRELPRGRQPGRLGVAGPACP